MATEKKEWEIVGAMKNSNRSRRVGRPGRGGNSIPRFRKPRGFADRVGDLSLRDVAATAAAAYKTGKYLVSLMNTEMKTLSTTATGVSVDYNGTVVNLSNIAQGTDVNTRDGDSILLQYCSMSVIAFNHASATFGGYVRILVFRDNEQDGVDPTPGNVLDTVGSPMAVVSPYNFFTCMAGTNRKHRFEILHDQVIRLTPTTDITNMLQWEQFYKGGNKHILYDAAASADASNREGALFLLMVSDQPTNTPTVNYFNRILFTDN